MVDGCADGDGLVVCTIAAAIGIIGVRRRYDAADGNSNGFVGEVRWMIAVYIGPPPVIDVDDGSASSP